MICDNIDNDLSNVLQKNQWGYRKGVSTESLLLYLTETWKINIDHGNVVGVIFTDFRKAFESVYHEVLFYKMQACGFYGNVLQWLVSYLKNRKQFVEPNGAKSQLYFVSHGVQQGSLLGPRLFSIYLNDFAESLSNGQQHLYADDTTAFATGNSVDQVIQLLNVLPKEIIQWCRVNKLTIHWGDHNKAKVHWPSSASKVWRCGARFHWSGQMFTKFGKNFVILNRWRQNEVKSAVWLQVIKPLTEETWGRGSVVLVVRTKCMAEQSAEHFTRFTAKCCLYTWQEQHDGKRHLLFGVYLQTWTDLYLLNFPIKMHYRYELTSTKVSMF